MTVEKPFSLNHSSVNATLHARLTLRVKNFWIELQLEKKAKSKTSIKNCLGFILFFF